MLSNNRSNVTISEEELLEYFELKPVPSNRDGKLMRLKNGTMRPVPKLWDLSVLHIGCSACDVNPQSKRKRCWKYFSSPIKGCTPSRYSFFKFLGVEEDEEWLVSRRSLRVLTTCANRNCTNPLHTELHVTKLVWRMGWWYFILGGKFYDAKNDPSGFLVWYLREVIRQTRYYPRIVFKQTKTLRKRHQINLNKYRMWFASLPQEYRWQLVADVHVDTSEKPNFSRTEKRKRFVPVGSLKIRKKAKGEVHKNYEQQIKLIITHSRARVRAKKHLFFGQESIEAAAGRNSTGGIRAKLSSTQLLESDSKGRDLVERMSKDLLEQNLATTCISIRTLLIDFDALMQRHANLSDSTKREVRKTLRLMHSIGSEYNKFIGVNT